MRRRILVAMGAIAAGGAIGACQDPTEITVRITTGEACGTFTGAAITTGPSVAEADLRFSNGYVAATTDHCDPSGFVGTLVMTPGETSGSIVVAAGVRDPMTGASQDATQCGAHPDHCIVAKRAFSFVTHRPLVLPIDLDPRCVGKVCDPGSTCYQGGCVDEGAVCSGDQCGLPVEHPGGTGEGDASSSSDGAYDAMIDLDGTTSDDGSITMSDATSDGTTMSSDASDGSTVDANMYPQCSGTAPDGQGGFIGYCAVTGGDSGAAMSCLQGGGLCCVCRCANNAGTVSCTIGGSMNMCSGKCQTF